LIRPIAPLMSRQLGQRSVDRVIAGRLEVGNLPGAGMIDERSVYRRHDEPLSGVLLTSARRSWIIASPYLNGLTTAREPTSRVARCNSRTVPVPYLRVWLREGGTQYGICNSAVARSPCGAGNPYR